MLPAGSGTALNSIGRRCRRDRSLCRRGGVDILTYCGAPISADAGAAPSISTKTPDTPRLPIRRMATRAHADASSRLPTCRPWHSSSLHMTATSVRWMLPLPVSPTRGHPRTSGIARPMPERVDTARWAVSAAISDGWFPPPWQHDNAGSARRGRLSLTSDRAGARSRPSHLTDLRHLRVFHRSAPARLTAPRDRRRHRRSESAITSEPDIVSCSQTPQIGRMARPPERALPLTVSR